MNSIENNTQCQSSWRAPPPCEVGAQVADIFTPALVVDLDKMEKNMQTLSKIMEKFPDVTVRPHFKAHKCPALAAMQVEGGAVGVCCQTLTEAEAVVYQEGDCVKDVLVSNQIIGKPKLRRLAALAKKACISVCVDDLNNVKDISEVAGETGVNIDCVTEVNVGQNRCGVEPGEAAAVLSREIMKLPNITFKGIQCYQGLNQHVRKAEDRQSQVTAVAQKTRETLKALSDGGIECEYVTGGGTGTFIYEAASEVFTEVQPGSYMLMDADYARNYGEDGALVHDFEHSLMILSTVQSVTAGSHAVVDVGMKGVSLDSGVPVVAENKEQTYICGGDEHGILKPAGKHKVGDLVWLIPGHCDPTVNLYDWLIGIRKGVVETVWSISGRGPGV